MFECGISKAMWTNVFALLADVNRTPDAPHDGVVIWALVIVIVVVVGLVWAFVRISNRKEKEYRERRTHEVE